MDERPLKIMMVCGSDPTAAGELLTRWLSEAIAAEGHEVLISLAPGGPPDEEGGSPGVTTHRHSFRLGSIRHEDRAVARGFAPDLIHARNTRRPAMRATSAYAGDTHAPVFVHWEDDEWSPLNGVPASRQEALRFAARRSLATLQPTLWNFSTRRTLSWATATARAFDALSPALAEEVRIKTGRECALILPASPQSAEGGSGGPPTALPPSIEGRDLLLYTGSIHYGRVPDIELVVAAVVDVQRRGHPVAFVHAGRNSAGLDLEGLAAAAGAEPGSVHQLGMVPFAQIPTLLRRASILLAPGHRIGLNRLPMPAKLIAYLMSGTPCIVFSFGAGELFEDRVEVVKTYSASPAELSERIIDLLTDHALRARLGAGGPRAARRLFDPATIAAQTIAFYRAGLAAGPGI